MNELYSFYEIIDLLPKKAFITNKLLSIIFESNFSHLFEYKDENINHSDNINNNKNDNLELSIRQDNSSQDNSLSQSMIVNTNEINSLSLSTTTTTTTITTNNINSPTRDMSPIKTPFQQTSTPSSPNTLNISPSTPTTTIGSGNDSLTSTPSSPKGSSIVVTINHVELFQKGNELLQRIMNIQNLLKRRSKICWVVSIVMVYIYICFFFLNIIFD